PSLSASVGVRVARGCLPGSTTLNGFSAGSSTKLCIRWLRPIPVLPAITAGVQPPLGVTDTTQPLSSAASIDVVPDVNWRRNSSSSGLSTAATTAGAAPRALAVPPVVPPVPAPPPAVVAPGAVVGQRSSSARNGFFSPWYGYGSPGPIATSFLAQLICLNRSLA